jgi:hypothetical protein
LTTKTLAPGLRLWMPCSTDATFGPVAAMRSLTWSSPFATYLSLQGEPDDGCGLKQSSARLEKPMSLPPMPSVTSWVSASSESNCGGFGSGDTFCDCVMSPVSAPLQLGSRSGRPRLGAARWE